MSYRYFDDEKKIYKGFEEVNGEYNSGGVVEGGNVEVMMKCPECNYVNYGEGEILSPDWSADTMESSQTAGGGSIHCERCEATYEINTFSGQQGLFISIEGIPDYWKFFIKITHDHDDNDDV